VARKQKPGFGNRQREPRQAGDKIAQWICRGCWVKQLRREKGSLREKPVSIVQPSVGEPGTTRGISVPTKVKGRALGGKWQSRSGERLSSGEKFKKLSQGGTELGGEGGGEDRAGCPLEEQPKLERKGGEQRENDLTDVTAANPTEKGGRLHHRIVRVSFERGLTKRHEEK